MLPVADVEERVREHGGLAFAVRTLDAWRAHPHGAGLAGLPPVAMRRTGAETPRRLGPTPSDGPLLPAAGVRVLDFTRVIAGPVGTRTLALLGADVLRVDPPNLPELPAQHLDTGLGKRSALLDLRTPTAWPASTNSSPTPTSWSPATAREHCTALRPRPGRTARPPPRPGRRHPVGVGPGPVVQYRGFDSLVQAPTGIAAIEADGDLRPAALPAKPSTTARATCSPPASCAR
ncbi:CoA transferase [Yinghuangia aomiensis]